MNLYPGRGTRERILTFGVEGTGKSSFILSLALKYPFGKFYVIDTEYGSYDALMYGSEFERLHPDNGGNVLVTQVDMDDWEEQLEAVDKIVAGMTRDDWIVVDSMTPTWQAVQSWFIDKVHGQGLDEYALLTRQAKQGSDKKSLGLLDGWLDWPVINPNYMGLYKRILRCPGHIYWTAEQDKISEDDDAQTKDVYGSSGVKPKGQKRLGHMTHTVLRLMRTRTGEWQMSTIKDRSRPVMERVVVNDPAMDYFMGG